MTTTVPATADLSNRVSEEIRAMMARRRMSGRELARRLGVSPAWVSYRLTNSQPIDLNDLQRVAAALEVEIEDLLPRKEGLIASSPDRHPVDPLLPRIVAVAGEERPNRRPVHAQRLRRMSLRPSTPALV